MFRQLCVSKIFKNQIFFNYEWLKENCYLYVMLLQEGLPGLPAAAGPQAGVCVPVPEGELNMLDGGERDSFYWLLTNVGYVIVYK